MKLDLNGAPERESSMTANTVHCLEDILHNSESYQDTSTACARLRALASAGDMEAARALVNGIFTQNGCLAATCAFEDFLQIQGTLPLSILDKALAALNGSNPWQACDAFSILRACIAAPMSTGDTPRVVRFEDEGRLARCVALECVIHLAAHLRRHTDKGTEHRMTEWGIAAERVCELLAVAVKADREYYELAVEVLDAVVKSDVWYPLRHDAAMALVTLGTSEDAIRLWRHVARTEHDGHEHGGYYARRAFEALRNWKKREPFF